MTGDGQRAESRHGCLALASGGCVGVSLRWALLTGAASGDHLSLFAGQAGPHEANCRSKLPVMGMTLPSD